MKLDKFNPKKEKELNHRERLKFIDYWANYVKTHSDKDWSSQQVNLINAQIQSARDANWTKKRYLKIKDELLE